MRGIRNRLPTTDASRHLPPIWLFLLLMLSVVVYAAWLSWCIQRAINREQATEEGQSLLNEFDEE